MGHKMLVVERAFRAGWDRLKCGLHCTGTHQGEPIHCMGCHVAGWLRSLR